MDETVELLLSLEFVESIDSKPHCRTFLRSDYTFKLSFSTLGTLINIKGWVKGEDILEFLWRVTFSDNSLEIFLEDLKKKLALDRKNIWGKYKNYLKNEKDIRSISEKIC